VDDHIERVRLRNPDRIPGQFTEQELEYRKIRTENRVMPIRVFREKTYEYRHPFQYPNVRVELGPGGEYNMDGVELQAPPQGAIVNAGRKVRRGSAQKCSTYAMYTPSGDGCQFSPMIASIEPSGCGGPDDAWTPAGDSSPRWLPGCGCGA